ncbi:MAG: SurA N-terminal domain-containing protein [Burkholderiaceae bacterium]
MFEFIRTHQRLMQFILLLFIFPSFAFFGLESYSRFSGGDNVVAKVAGQPITQQDWDAALREQMERFRQMFGERFNPAMFDTPQVKQEVLDNLIAQRALAAEATRAQLSVSDQALQQAILDIPGLVGADGTFDGARYKELLAMQGLTPVMYEARLRHDLALQQLNSSIQATAFAPKALAARLSDLSDQERVAQQLLVKASDFAAQVKVTDDMLKAYYDQHGQQFVVPEHAKIEYVVLDANALAAQTPVSDDDIKSYYEQNKQRYTTEEQRRASHILITVSKDASAKDKEAAKAKAEALLAEVRKDPAAFAKVAKENSQDPGSAEQGGDLGYFGRQAMVKPFEDAVFQLKEGEISGLVPTEFGYHIIKLTGIKPGSVKPLAEVKDEIAAEIKKQLAAKKFSEMADLFGNTVYEQADSLQPVADKLKLAIQSANDVTRTPNPALAPNLPYNDPKFLKALFTDDVIRAKHNTEVVEVAPNTLIAGRIVEHKPAAKRPFEEVQAQIRKQVVQDEAARLARESGKSRLAALKAKDDASGFGAEKTVSRSKDGGLDPQAQATVMKADVRQLPAYAGVELADGDYAILRISKVVQPANPDQARRQAEQQQLANVLAQEEMTAYIDVLKQKAKVQILKPVTAEPEADGAAQ